MPPTKLRFFQLHNPFYLLSALSMLAGCYGLVQSFETSWVHPKTLLALIAVLQVYELLLVGLAWWLISSGKAERDGRMLLLLELVFLVDATFLNAEYCAADPEGGVFVGLLMLILAVIKANVMLHALGIKAELAIQAFLLAHFGVLFVIPLFSAQLFRDEHLSDKMFYAMWWIIGTLPLLQRGAIAALFRRKLRTDWLRPIELNFRIAFIALPLVSILWHVASLHWMYGVGVLPCHLTPLILGLGLSLSLLVHKWGSSKWGMTILEWTPLLGLLLSLGNPSSLTQSIGGTVLPEAMFSPLRFSLFAASIIYAVGYVAYRRRVCLLSSVVTSLLALGGHSITTILSNLFEVVPKTTVEWCMMAIVGGFVFLLWGVIVSLSGMNASPTSSGRGLQR